MNHIRSCVVGSGVYLPQRTLANTDLMQSLDTTHEWIKERTGIERRHIADSTQLTSDLAYHACKNALDNAQISPQEIDLIILATTTPDNTFPATATRLQQKIGNTRGWAFDVGGACSGFLVALTTADMFIRQGKAKHVLVAGADLMSRIVDWTDRKTAILFGDGAGAVVLTGQTNTSSGIIGSVIRSDGRGYDHLYVSGGAGSTKECGTIRMNGKEVYKKAVYCLSEVIASTLKEYAVNPKDVDWFVPHQANKRIIEHTAQISGIEPKKVIDTIACHGNTSAASIPLALHEAVSCGKIQKNHTILSAAFGGGFIWGACLFRW